MRTADGDVLPALARACNDASNIVVEKAVSIVAERCAVDLIDVLLAAYERAFIDPLESDPLCRTKIAVARALRDLDVRDPRPFVRGMHYFQKEAAWGKPVDTAVNLRTTCAAALTTTDLPDTAVLRELVDLLAGDPEELVRIEAARTIAAVAGMESVLVLRCKALCSDSAAEVVGECLAAIAALQPSDGVAFIERFLAAERAAIRFEALYALAASRAAGAHALVARAWNTPLPDDVRRALLYSCAASAATEAADFLLSVISAGDAESVEPALSALATSRFRDAYCERARSAVSALKKKTLLDVYRAAFDSVGSRDER